MKKQFPVSIENIPGSIKQRVFIGGDYRNIAILREIKKLVSKLGFQPILLADFTIPRDGEYQSALVLLSNCKFAIFEVSTSSGAYMEVVKCKDFRVRVLLIYQVLIEGAQHIYRMITSFVDSYDKSQLWAYPNFNEMRKIIKQWLPKRGFR